VSLRAGVSSQRVYVPVFLHWILTSRMSSRRSITKDVVWLPSGLRVTCT
jgi:hypothetical protein